MIGGDDIETKIKATKFLVEATDAEQYFLWAQHSSESRDRPPSYPKLTWKQHACGSLMIIGYLKLSRKKMPVSVSLMFATINGSVVCFWWSTSQVVDHRLIGKWIDKTFAHVPPREGRTNAMNFHIVTNALHG